MIILVTIGILGSKGKSIVGDLISAKANSLGYKTIIVGTKENSKFEFLKILNDDIEYIIIEISREDLIQKRLEKIKFDILVQTEFEKENEELISEVQRLICSLREDGYIIFNSDSIQKINFQCSSIYVITYGLNGKTTVTASSIDNRDSLCFSYCLQRSIFNIAGEVIHPFEKPYKFDGKPNLIYYYLAAITSCIILGLKL